MRFALDEFTEGGTLDHEENACLTGDSMSAASGTIQERQLAENLAAGDGSDRGGVFFQHDIDLTAHDDESFLAGITFAEHAFAGTEELLREKTGDFAQFTVTQAFKDRQAAQQVDDGDADLLVLKIVIDDLTMPWACVVSEVFSNA